MTKIQKKWRESKIDLSKLHLKTIHEFKVISYPPAGNDVFDCIGKLNSGNSISFILKSERGTFANFDNEIKILQTIKNFPIPTVIETGKIDNFTYIVMSKMKGEKLSDLFEKSTNVDKSKYLFLYGQELAKVHKIKLNWSIAKQRDINDIPKKSIYKISNDWEAEIIRYLEETKPKIIMDTFIHGDFHYGNILWEDYKVSAILDWEYSGIGFKEQDIAWALILRPSQKFMDNMSDYKYFLKGYNSINNFDYIKLKWCLINGLLHFYLMNKNENNDEYLSTLLEMFFLYTMIEDESDGL